MKVLCFGSLNIDYTYKVDHFVKKGETLASEQLQVFTGGKGLNQSVALARAGVETYHAGTIGEDGRFLLQELHNASVNTDFVTILQDARTGNAIIQNDKNGDNCILIYGGANQLITKEQVDLVLSNFEEGDFLVLQNEINGLPYIIEQAYQKKMRIVLNPSPMNETIGKLPLEFISYFILNEIEASQILKIDLSDELDKEKLARLLFDQFPNSAIVLTMGSKGSVYLDNKECVNQDIYRVQTVDTTAAGDTFTGYFIAGLLRGDPIKTVMDFAARASAITVTRSGAAPAIPKREEVEIYKF